ncbi:MAG TPA: malectin domain-containing carbohydrate-binding protein [Cytophagales bacterium]|nr:malectin domain-containing carbohydrate-binding protein [Cytophagales bacterium]
MKKPLLALILLGICFNLSAQISTPFYYEDFETSFHGWSPNEGEAAWTYGTPSGPLINSAASGNNAFYTNISSPSETREYYLSSPVFNLSNRINQTSWLSLSFQQALALESTAEAVKVQIKLDEGYWQDLGRPTSLASIAQNWYNSEYDYYYFGWSNISSPWREVKHVIQLEPENQFLQIRIVYFTDHYSSQTAEGIAIDNFSLNEIQTSGVSESDSLALVSLYNSTNGPGWARNDNWLTGPVSNWYGIELDEPYAIVSINLGGNNLSGSIPAEFSEIRSYWINLNNNNLTGSIPVQMGDVFGLRGLDLSNNQLSGTVPKELGELRLLKDLNLSHNNLSGNLPAEIAAFPVIWYVDLSYNNLSGNIPDFGQSPQLGPLKLDHNHFTSISIVNRYPGLTDIRYNDLPVVELNEFIANSIYFEGTAYINPQNYGEINTVNTILYRVNCGGQAIAASPVAWERDVKTAPSSYFVPTTTTISEGSSWWPNMGNNTEAPNALFGSYRVGWGNGLKYKFPVETGQYIVNLYFAAKQSSTSIPGKTFDVRVENQLFLDNFDIFGTAGFEAIKESFYPGKVEDGFIDLEFLIATSYPQVNGIEIIKISVGSEDSPSIARLITEINEIPEKTSQEKITVYPNPLNGTNLNISLPKHLGKEVTIQIADQQNRLQYSKDIFVNEGQSAYQLDLSNTGIQRGLYFLKVLSTTGFRETIKITKE